MDVERDNDEPAKSLSKTIIDGILALKHTPNNHNIKISHTHTKIYSVLLEDANSATKIERPSHDVLLDEESSSFLPSESISLHNKEILKSKPNEIPETTKRDQINEEEIRKV